MAQYKDIEYHNTPPPHAEEGFQLITQEHPIYELMMDLFEGGDWGDPSVTQ